MKYIIVIMHKETLVTASSSNPEEHLLFYAQQEELSEATSDSASPEEITGWAAATKMVSSQGIKLNPKNIIRRRSISSNRRAHSNHTSDDADKSKDTLKLKLHEYTGNPDAESEEKISSSCRDVYSSTLQSFNSITIDVPSEDFVKGHKLKGFQRKFNLKRSRNQNNSVSTKTKRISIEKCPQIPPVRRNGALEERNSSFRMKDHWKVSAVSYPLDIEFPSDEEGTRLRSKLHSYLQTHFKLSQV